MERYQFVNTFVELHDKDYGKLCIFNVCHFVAVYFDWESNSTAISLYDGSIFNVRESVEDVWNIIYKSRYC